MLGGSVVLDLERRGWPRIAPVRDQLDLMGNALDATIAGFEPGAVINAAAFTDVQAAEREDQRAEVYRLNRDAPGRLAGVCRRLGIPFLHVSTDFVFDGAKTEPYREDDPVRPIQEYGRSKLEGERNVLDADPDALVVRTSTLYGPGRVGRPHYVDAILRQALRGAELRVVRLPVSSPTYVPDLARGMIELLVCGAAGRVHFVNRGACSRLDLARETVRLAGLAASVEVTERAAPQGDLKRPPYSVLDTSRFAELTGFPPRPWQKALAEYVKTASPA